MIGTADVHTGIAEAWDAGGLNDVFQALWPSGSEDYPVLSDQEATPGQPWPYCVMESDATTTLTRMSASATGMRETRDVPIRFHVHAKTAVGDVRSAKALAAYLSDEVLKVFGGHPTSTPRTLTLSTGQFLLTRFVSEYGARSGDEEYEWVINFLVRIDVPVET